MFLYFSRYFKLLDFRQLFHNIQIFTRLLITARFPWATLLLRGGGPLFAICGPNESKVQSEMLRYISLHFLFIFLSLQLEDGTFKSEKFDLFPLPLGCE